MLVLRSSGRKGRGGEGRRKEGEEGGWRVEGGRGTGERGTGKGAKRKGAKGGRRGNTPTTTPREPFTNMLLPSKSKFLSNITCTRRLIAEFENVEKKSGIISELLVGKIRKKKGGSEIVSEFRSFSSRK
jgi:hypothetical protein